MSFTVVSVNCGAAVAVNVVVVSIGTLTAKKLTKTETKNSH